jgi:spore maturation protein CgeB
VIQDGPFVSKINSSGGNAYYLPVAAQFPSGSAATGSIYRSSVSFAGAPYRNRIKILTSLADEGISIFGENWSDAASGALKNSVKIGARRVSTEELRAIYAMSGINLNIYSSIFCDGVEEHRDYVNPRTFEIPAVGGFQLCDMRKGIEKFFKPGTEIELFASIDELREKIRFFRKNSKTASKIAECGQRRVREEHTYGHRMNEALNIIKTGRPYVHTMQA